MNISNIQIQSGWRVHTPNDGSQIGGKQPDNWGWWAGRPVGKTAAMLAVEGPAYATVEAYLLLPPIPSASLRMGFELLVDAQSLAALELIETDLLRLDGKVKRNHSVQRFFAKGMQVANVTGGWADTGINPALLVPDVVARHDIYYATDPTGKYGTQAIVLDEELYLIAPQLQGLVPQPSNWTAGEMIQIQITLGDKPGRAYIVVDNLSIQTT